MNIYDAKTQFSKLVKRVRAGEEIIIADAGRPVAKLVPIEAAPRPRVLGADRGKIWIAEDAFAPMTAEELAEWEDGPIFPPEPAPAARRKTRRPAKQPRRARR